MVGSVSTPLCPSSYCTVIQLYLISLHSLARLMTETLAEVSCLFVLAKLAPLGPLRFRAFWLSHQLQCFLVITLFTTHVLFNSTHIMFATYLCLFFVETGNKLQCPPMKLPQPQHLSIIFDILHRWQFFINALQIVTVFSFIHLL